MNQPNRLKEKNTAPVSLSHSIILLILIIAMIAYFAFKGINLSIPLFLTWIIIFIYCYATGRDWESLQNAAFQSVHGALGSVFILLAVGALIGSWIQCGTIPTVITYGLKMISPSAFLPCTMLLCSILALATGTSYGSVATAGIAMMGVGLTMGFPAGMIAGAVICGALFGDKMSPFSDTTNIAPAMAGGDLFKHIRMMMYNTVPAWIISMVIFWLIGGRYASDNFDLSTINSFTEGLAQYFNISIITLLPMVLVIVLLLLKWPAVPVILLGAVSGGIVSLIIQGNDLLSIIKCMHNGFSIDSGIELVDKLLNRGGVNSMQNVVWIILTAVGMGGMLDKLGVLQNFLKLIVGLTKKTWSLVAVTMLISYIVSAVGCTQTMAHVVTGKLLAPIYRERGLAPELLSRTMEDSGTLGGAFFPWHTNAVYFCGVLAVSWGEYIPFLFLSFITPIISIIYACIGFKIPLIDPITGEPLSHCINEK